MYHSNGNYQAFIRPKKSETENQYGAYLVGAGLASLASAVFLIRDANVKGENIHILEELPISGGSLDAAHDPNRGFVMRGGREMEEHFETLWDLFRSIPSLEMEDASVLDEFAWKNLEDPSFSYARVIKNRGERLETDGKLTLSEKSINEIMELALMQEKDLDDKKINEVLGKEFFESNFWLYWSTMFAFEPWASALEMRRYLLRFVHHIASLSNMSALRYTQYNQYESLVLPLLAYLKDHNVDFQYNTVVNNIEFAVDSKGEKVAKALDMTVDGKAQTLALKETDLVFVTNGSITESTTYGNNTTAPSKEITEGPAWTLWKNLAKQDETLGHPEKFCENIPEANWVISGTITLSDDQVIPYIEKISKKNPHSGSIVTSGPVTIQDSNWLYGYSISRQPVFKAQKPNETIVWVYGLYSDKEGNYVPKKIVDCTGIELCEEWLYHIGVPEDKIVDIATNAANTVPCHMPYITSYFCPRAVGDRPLVVPTNYKNLAFIGNFAETDRDTVFTTEYSVRTAMEAVYTFFPIQRGVPEVFDSSYDVRTLLKTLYYINDQKDLAEIKLPIDKKLVENHVLHKVKGTYIEELLHDERLL